MTLILVLKGLILALVDWELGLLTFPHPPLPHHHPRELTHPSVPRRRVDCVDVVVGGVLKGLRRHLLLLQPLLGLPHLLSQGIADGLAEGELDCGVEGLEGLGLASAFRLNETRTLLRHLLRRLVVLTRSQLVVETFSTDQVRVLPCLCNLKHKLHTRVELGTNK